MHKKPVYVGNITKIKQKDNPKHQGEKILEFVIRYYDFERKKDTEPVVKYIEAHVVDSRAKSLFAHILENSPVVVSGPLRASAFIRKVAHGTKKIGDPEVKQFVLVEEIELLDYPGRSKPQKSNDSDSEKPDDDFDPED